VLTFAQIKALKASQQQSAQQPLEAVAKSPRSLHIVDVRCLSPRPERVQVSDVEFEDEQVEGEKKTPQGNLQERFDLSDNELEEQLKQLESEHERVRSNLRDMEEKEIKQKADVANFRERSALDKDVKYAQLELQFATERLAKVR
jgi:hypothetical protein